MDKLNKVNTMGNVYSVNSFKMLIQACDTLAAFLNEYYPEIRLVKNIKAEHLQAYVDLNYENWTTKTAKDYAYWYKKLSVLINKTYHCRVNFSSVVFVKRNTGKLKDKAFEPEDFKKLAVSLLSSSSGAKFLPLITYMAGTRIEEACSVKPENINLEKRVLELRNCKGGRNRDVPIRMEFLLAFSVIKNFCIENNWETICNGISVKSALSVLKSHMKKVGIAEKYDHETNHAIRKLYARWRFKYELEDGLSPEEAWVKVQVELGHGKHARNELFRVYIGKNYSEFVNNWYGGIIEPVI